ncbi:phosphoglycerate dehydrogenase [Ramlibacter tataouinensis]|uniref:Candidate D-3-phosphoglycerate dehydrogenase (Phosphoglycerate dehydrogenase) n=1 Tax=Ramlibacter tataouinensis (strain ATCC BAA-407 / DSM 14655 / LMG 21543 / TTB310) TaxID=365046 RepID=F5Y693_RAMTT|nr:phosphoglycerate dehydrogenase [Ramlibacter tataouinensis]AEG92779.1 candidate D-3-phosphoglycerate dehydrogenase (phosphoglycerate dehydrogenase) [Ramlibacter tataouinensis TTB310]
MIPPQRLSVPKDKLKFVLLEGIHASAIESLRAQGYEHIVTSPKALAGDELRAAVADAHFLGIRSRTQLTEAVLAAAPKLTAIGAFCIGTNQIDLRAALRRGVPVFNAPFSNTRSVAELVLAEVVMLMRGIPHKNAVLHRNGWVKSAAGSYEVRGKTLGIVGYGHIGTQVGVLAEHLGMQVVFCDVEAKLTLGNARQLHSLDAVLEQADVVTLHVPETPQTLDMIAAPQLARMKPGSHLINASRGTVVDIAALADALERGHLAGAAIDVFPVEPQGNDARFDSPLVRFDNVLLTPHIGGSTAEAQENIGREVAAKLVRYSDNGSTVSAVNFPEVSLPEPAGRSRLLHIHRNVPGVMAAVNERFSVAGINIAAQYLRTNEEVGYVVIDVDGAASRVAMEELCGVPGTIRCRVLY